MPKTTELEKIEETLLNRIIPGYGKWISCSSGWYLILDDLDRQLSYLDPDYKIAQIKEKFGGLRFYYEPTKGGLVQDLMDAAIKSAEYAASRTCEECGKSSFRSDKERGIEYDSTAVLKVRSGWYKTICDTCDQDSAYKSMEELKAIDDISDMEIYIKQTRESIKDGEDPLDVYLAIAKKDLLGN